MAELLLTSIMWTCIVINWHKISLNYLWTYCLYKGRFCCWYIWLFELYFREPLFLMERWLTCHWCYRPEILSAWLKQYQSHDYRSYDTCHMNTGHVILVTFEEKTDLIHITYFQLLNRILFVICIHTFDTCPYVN